MNTPYAGNPIHLTDKTQRTQGKPSSVTLHEVVSLRNHPLAIDHSYTPLGIRHLGEEQLRVIGQRQAQHDLTLRTRGNLQLALGIHRIDDGIERRHIQSIGDLSRLDDPGAGSRRVDSDGEEILRIADGSEIQDAPVLGIDDILLLGEPLGAGENGTVVGEIGGTGRILAPQAPPHHQDEQHDDHELCLHTLPPISNSASSPQEDADS